MNTASESNQHILASAQNPIIYGGTFANVAGNLTINTTERPGLKRLLADIAPGAFHDAAERGDLPKCHPRTRVAIREDIMQWIKDPGVREQFITWLYGPAGSGKTAIAQSIAEACEEEGLLAASFFFGRLANGRNTLAHFVATLAYQLSRSIPEMADPLLMAIEKDPSIFSRSLSTQMRVLIIEP
ncbi:hypothetical protein BJ912DRAFT_989111 [Pholiota molesta]|nr:hypothetical protein BJ912DRAFT_989111 [Pholiota molesta]